MHPGVVSDSGILETTEGKWSISRYIEGWDVDALLEANPAGLPEPALSELLVGVHRALAVGPHGALSGANIRITPSADVYVCGFQGEGGDEGAIEGFRVAWGGAGQATLAAVVAGMPAGSNPLYPHPLSGKNLSRGQLPAGVPNKVRTAAFAAVTLVLGLVSGWFLASGG